MWRVHSSFCAEALAFRTWSEIKGAAWRLAEGHGLGLLLVISWLYHAAVRLAFG